MAKLFTQLSYVRTCVTLVTCVTNTPQFDVFLELSVFQCEHEVVMYDKVVHIVGTRPYMCQICDIPDKYTPFLKFFLEKLFKK